MQYTTIHIPKAYAKTVDVEYNDWHVIETQHEIVLHTFTTDTDIDDGNTSSFIFSISEPRFYNH